MIKTGSVARRPALLDMPMPGARLRLRTAPALAARPTHLFFGYLRRGWDFSAAFGLATSESATNWQVTNASYKGGTTSGSMTAIEDYITIGPAGAYSALISPKGLALPAYSSTTLHGYRTFSVRLQSGCANKSAWLLWRRTTDATFNVGRAVQTTFGLRWVTLTFNLSAHSDWNGTIDQLWLSPSEQCSTGEINIACAYFGR